MSGITTRRTISAFMRATMSFGVPTGAQTPYQVVRSKSGTPASISVGTSGSTASLLVLEAPSAFSLPLRMKLIDEGSESNISCTWPPTRSASAGPLPL